MTVQVAHELTQDEIEDAITSGRHVGSIDSVQLVRSSTLASSIVRASRSTDQSTAVINLVRVYVVGNLDLSDMEIPSAIQFIKCWIAGDQGIDVSGATIRRLTFSQCQVSRLHARGTELGGSFIFQDSVAFGTVDLENARILGDINVSRSHIQAADTSEPALAARQTTVSGSVVAHNFTAVSQGKPPTVWLDNLKVRSEVGFRSCNLVNPGGCVLSANTLEVDGSLTLQDTTVQGVCSDPIVSLNALRARGSVYLIASRVLNPTGTAVRGVNMRVDGHLQIADRTSLSGASEKGTLRLNASSCGQLSITETEIVNDDGPCLSADGLTIVSALQIEDSYLRSDHTEGALLLRSARIGSQLEFTNVEFSRHIGPAVSMDQAEVKGSFHLRRVRVCRRSSLGSIRMPGAKLLGQLSFTDVRVFNEAGSCLHLDGLELGDTLSLQDVHLVASSDRATLSLKDLRAKRQVQITESVLINRIGCGVDLQGADISSSLAIHRSSMYGGRETLRMYATRVRDTVQIHDSSIASSTAGSSAMQLQNGRIEGALDIGWDELIGRAGDNCFLVDLDGCKYDISVDSKYSVKFWIALLEQHSWRFATQPYRHLAELYRKSGQHKRSREVLIALERSRFARDRDMDGAERVWHMIEGAVIGYGYRSSRALRFLALSWLAAIIVVLIGGSVGGVLDNPKMPSPSDCSIIEQIGYATDAAVPLIGAGTKLQGCEIVANSVAGQATLAATRVLQFLSWSFAVLFVAGFSGLVKKT